DQPAGRRRERPAVPGRGRLPEPDPDPVAAPRARRARARRHAVPPRVARPGLAGPDAGAEASRSADGRGLAAVTGRVEQRDAAQHRGAGPAREALHDLLGAHAEGALTCRALHGVGRHRALPVLGLEAADDLARAPSHLVAILAQRAELD